VSEGNNSVYSENQTIASSGPSLCEQNEEPLKFKQVNNISMFFRGFIYIPMFFLWVAHSGLDGLGFASR
jgi:hypothetical protein